MSEKQERKFSNAEIEKFVYKSAPEDENSNVRVKEEAITLEELKNQENKTKRPVHTRPVIKTGIVSVIFLPFFLFIFWFTNRGQSISQQSATDRSGVSQIDRSLQQENQQLKDQVDRLEIEIARVGQQEDIVKKENPSTKTEEKADTNKVVKTQATPKPQPKPQATPKPQPRTVVSKAAVVLEPTEEEKRQKVRTIASSIIYGGKVGSQSNLKDNTANNSAVLVQSQEKDLVPSIELESSLLEEKSHQKFTAGSLVKGLLLHPVFLQNDSDSPIMANILITESNTPLPKGTSLQVQFDVRDSVLNISSIKATVEGQAIELDARYWQLSSVDDSPIVVSSFSNEDNKSDGTGNQIARNALRNMEQTYRTDNGISSFLFSTGTAVLKDRLERGEADRDIDRNNIALTIPQDTQIKLYVIETFEKILP